MQRAAKTAPCGSVQLCHQSRSIQELRLCKLSKIVKNGPNGVWVKWTTWVFMNDFGSGLFFRLRSVPLGSSGSVLLSPAPNEHNAPDRRGSQWSASDL